MHFAMPDEADQYLFLCFASGSNFVVFKVSPMQTSVVANEDELSADSPLPDPAVLVLGTS